MRIAPRVHELARVNQGLRVDHDPRPVDGASSREQRRSVLAPGRNCWRIEAFNRLAFLIDSAAYFEAFVQAVQAAEQQILITGWDIHSDTELLCPADGEAALRLSALLESILARKPKLEIFILVWRASVLYLWERETIPRFLLPWKTNSRLHVRYVDPGLGVALHQKLVAIDGSVAFAGGIDLTVARWDTPEHSPSDQHRRLPDGAPYGPIHDVQVVLDGPAARAVDEIVRESWNATPGPPISPLGRLQSAPWPAAVDADVRDGSVGIARTKGHGDSLKPREIKALYADALASAQRCVYIENQYLTSPSILEMLSERLVQANGPEILIVTPKQQSGHLEQVTMGALRANLVGKLRSRDVHQRLRVVWPHVEGEAVNVHSKLMIIDDSIAIIGSANLTRRSFELDTECNLVIEAGAGQACAAAIERLRALLLAEHLGAEPNQVVRALRHGSLFRTLDRLSQSRRGLRSLEISAQELNIPATLLDPERPIDEALVEEYMPNGQTKKAAARRLPRLVVGLGLLVGLAVVWIATPVQRWLDVGLLLDFSDTLRHRAWGPPLAVGLFAAATVCLFPLLLAVVVVVLVFGPWLGFACALLGSLVSALTGFWLGHWLGGETLRKFLASRVKLVKGAVKHGFLATLALRLVPAAPFGLVNLTLGSAGIRYRDFLLGTLAGMTPGLLIMAHGSEQVIAAVRRPNLWNVGLALLILGVVILVVLWLRRLLQRALINGSRAG